MDRKIFILRIDANLHSILVVSRLASNAAALKQSLPSPSMSSAVLYV
jgi:hypothetical protein